MDLCFVAPEIPHNTGCAARLSAALGIRLHLVEPLGFSLEDRYLKRAGLDYWPLADLVLHPSLEAFVAQADAAADEHGGRGFAQRARLFTARGGRSLFETDFAPDDLLLFGSESSGLPAELLEAHGARRVYVPIRAGVRSLNLANTACLAAYTALSRAGVPLPDNDGAYVPCEADARPAQRVRRSAEPE